MTLKLKVILPNIVKPINVSTNTVYEFEITFPERLLYYPNEKFKREETCDPLNEIFNPVPSNGLFL